MSRSVALRVLTTDATDLALRVAALKRAAQDLGFEIVLDREDDAGIERRARAAYERLGFGPAWERLDADQRERYRVVARRG